MYCFAIANQKKQKKFKFHAPPHFIVWTSKEMTTTFLNPIEGYKLSEKTFGPGAAFFFLFFNTRTLTTLVN